jgi:hypothetical protein
MIIVWFAMPIHSPHLGKGQAGIHLPRYNRFGWYFHLFRTTTPRLVDCVLILIRLVPVVALGPRAVPLDIRWRYWGIICRGGVLLAWPSRQTKP